MAQAPEAQREQIIKFTQYAMQYGFAASPVLILVFGAIATVVVWGTINFVFAWKSTFVQVFAVLMYASLPSILKSLLGTVVIFAGLARESFHIENPAPTSVGAFVSPQDVGPALLQAGHFSGRNADLVPSAVQHWNGDGGGREAELGLHHGVWLVGDRGAVRRGHGGGDTRLDAAHACNAGRLQDMNKFSLEGTLAMVTGASRGIGRSAAAHWARAART